MVRQARGIEVFGHGATVVEVGPRQRGPRTPALGSGAALMAVIAVAAIVGAIVERSRGSAFAPTLTWISLGASAVAVLGGLVALVTGRGRIPGFVAVVVGALANPWLLSRLLEWVASLATS